MPGEPRTVSSSAYDHGLDAAWEVRNRTRPLLHKAELSKADLHALVDAIVELRDLADRDERPGSPVRRDAEEIANLLIAPALLRGLFGWLAPAEPDAAAWQRFIHGPEIPMEDPPLRRADIKMWLARTPNMLPVQLRGALYNALDWLDDGSGYVPPLFTPTPKQGHGVKPLLARMYEENIWCWIAYQVGRGRTIEDARREVSDAVGRVPGAVDAWRRNWVKRDGAEKVKAALAEWQERGANGHVYESKSYRTDLPFLARPLRLRARCCCPVYRAPRSTAPQLRARSPS